MKNTAIRRGEKKIKYLFQLKLTSSQVPNMFKNFDCMKFLRIGNQTEFAFKSSLLSAAVRSSRCFKTNIKNTANKEQPYQHNISDSRGSLATS